VCYTLQVESKFFLLYLGGSDSGIWILQLNIQLLGTSDNFNALARRHIVGNLSLIRVVLHHEHFQILLVVDQNCLEPVGRKELGFLVAPVTNLGHGNLSLEPATNSVINTLWLPPGLLRYHTIHQSSCICHSDVS
jgi:hypothetical protein